MPRKIAITDLKLEEPLKGSLFSSVGDLLLGDGVLFNAGRLKAFQDAGITEVYTPEEREPEDDCRSTLRYSRTSVADFKPGEVVGVSIFDARGNLLVQEGAPLARGHRQALLNQGIEYIYTRKPIDMSSADQVHTLREILNQLAVEEATTEFGKAFEQASLQEDRFSDDGAMTPEKLAEIARREAARVLGRDERVRKLVQTERLVATEDKDNREALHKTRLSLIQQLQQMFDDLAAGRLASGDTAGDVVRRVVEGLVSNRFHRLHIAEPEESQIYLTSHSLNTCILSINMAARIGYGMNEILELGYAALLHDVGMLKVPAAIAGKTTPLNGAERAVLRQHPSFGLDLLQNVKRLPATTRLVIYQENERLDGSGYPLGKSAVVLIPYTRVISAAAVFDAMTRDRPWRPARGSYDAITELLREVHERRYDAECVRALLETLSLFPVSSGVELTDGRVGYVLDASGKDYTRPVVAVEYDADGRPFSRELIVDLQRPEHHTIRIVRAIPQYAKRHPTGSA